MSADDGSAPGITVGTAPPAGAPELAAALLTERVARMQRAARLPALSAAASVPGAAGSEPRVVTAVAGCPAPAPAAQLRIGSITKTFTAALVLQLRDEGRLRLDDPLESHLPGTPAGRATLRDLLAHRARLAREPEGPFWEAVPGPSARELVDGLRADYVLLEHAPAWHYSNIGYALLGRVVEVLRAAPYREVLARHLTGPLELRRTTWDPVAPYEPGWRVRVGVDELVPEPMADTAAMGPAGQLWSTPTDLARWGAFLARPDAAVLSAESVEAMCEPLSITDTGSWRAGYGLGLQLFRRDDEVLVGHGGSMPGFVAGLVVSRASGVAVAACCNAWQGADLPGLAADVVVAVARAVPPAPWSAVTAPAEVRELVGDWWDRGAPFVAECRDGRLTLRSKADVEGVRRERFEREGPDLFRGLDAGQGGEPLRVVRDEAGVPVVLDLGGWLLTRTADDPRGGP